MDFEQVKKDIIGRVYLQDGLKGFNGEPSVSEYGIEDITQLDNGFYSGELNGEPVIIDTYLSVTEHGKGKSPNYTVVVIGLEREKKNADLCMGGDGANSVYLLGKKVRAESVGNWQELKERSQYLSEQSAKTLAGVYWKLDPKGRKAINRFLQYLKFDIPDYVINILAEMVKEVPLETYQDFKDVGFYSNAAKRGNSDDLFALKAACGLKQAGKDPKSLFKGGEFKDRAEIEKAVMEALGEYEKEGVGVEVNRALDKVKKMYVDMVVEKFKVGKKEAQERVDKFYDPKKSDEENIRAILKGVTASYRRGVHRVQAMASTIKEGAPDGGKYLEIDLEDKEQKKINVLPAKHRRAAGEKFINDNYPTTYTMDTGGDVLISSETAYELRKRLPKLYITRVSRELGKLLEVARFSGKENNTRYENPKTDFTRFVYAKVWFKIGKDFFVRKLNIGLRIDKDGKQMILYDISQWN